MGQLDYNQPVGMDPFQPYYNMDSRVSAGFFNNSSEALAQQNPGSVNNPCRNDIETSFHDRRLNRKQKEPDEYDDEKV